MSALKDLTGQRFGRWEVIARAENTAGCQSRWLCRCDCGEERAVLGASLCFGKSTSCGCFQKNRASLCNKKHGLSKTRIYAVWLGMIARCERSTNRDFSYYGGRGIVVCKRWHVFDNFLADMGEPSENMTIDRIDVNGNYEPGNCRWATREQQCLNTRRTRNLTLGTKTQTMSQWASDLGVSASFIHKRLRRGWSVERALTI